MPWFKRFIGLYEPTRTDPPPAPPPAPKQDLGTTTLTPVSGHIHGYLFETDHPQVQIPLSLFWEVKIKFEPVPVTEQWADVMEAESWPSSLSFDWITWPISNLASLEGMTLKQLRETDSLETSIYLYGEHWPVNATRLEIARSDSGTLSAAFGAGGQIDLGDATAKLEANGQCDLAMKGIIVTPNNHFPKPNTPDLATAMLSRFIETNDLEPSQNELGQFLFVPKN